MTKRFLTLWLVFLIAGIQAFAQMTVTGKVTDSKGEGLIGVNILVDGTTNGTITDVDGNYRIAGVKQGQKLVFTSIGYKTVTASVGTNDVINAVLEDDSTFLDDVVVVGYGTTKKANLTGAVDQVGQDVFENRPVANMQQMIRGVMPNVQADFSDGKPSRTTTFIVRGAGNIGNCNTSSDGNALVLIDGVEGDPELVNPNDIESVSVLKDAASAAIYGSRGPYGVILITTKDPSKNQDKVRVDYSANFNFATPTAIPNIITDGLEFAELARQARYGYNSNYTVANLGSAQYFYDYSGKATDINDYVNRFRDYRAAGNTDDVYVDPTGRYHYYGSTNWYDYLYQDVATSQIHNISVSGNSGKVSYFISGRLYDYDGLYNYDPDTYKTKNLRAKVSAPIFPWLTIKENVEYTYDKVHQPVSSGTGVSSLIDATESFAAPETYIAQKGFPTMPVYNPDGTLTHAGAFVFGSMINKSSFVDVSKKMFKTTTALEASFFNNTLRFHGDYTYRDKSSDKHTRKNNVQYSDIQGEMLDLLSGNKLHQQYISDAFTFNEYNGVNAYAEYENTFGGAHYFKAMVGYNYEQNVRNTYDMGKRGLVGDYADTYEMAKGEYVAADGSYQNYPYVFGQGYKKYRVAGVFYRLNYAFKDRYLLEVDGRYDGSSLFPYTHQWASFPSASIGWRVDQEPWWHVNTSVISSLKIRGSYGDIGDTASIGPYNFQEKFSQESWGSNRVINGNANASYMEFPTDVNSAYTWARVRTVDGGIDLGLLGGKVSVTADYYLRRTYDMLIEGANYPETFGSKSAKTNSGQMSTYGWEALASYNDSWMVGGKPFHFGVKFSISDNYTVVDKYYNDTNSIGSWAFRSGQRFGEIWGYRSNGLFQSQDQINTAFDGKPYVNTLILTNSDKQPHVGDLWLLDLNGNGKIDIGEDTADDPGDREILGNVTARYCYGINLDMDWNGIFFSATFNGVGHQDWSPAGKNLIYGLYGNQSRNMLRWTADNMWSEDNPDALFPRLSAANKYFDGNFNHWSCYMNKYPVDRYIFNIAYLRLQNLQIGYTLPKSLVKKVSLSSAKVYLSAENVWTWSPFYRKYTRDFDILTINSHGDDPGNGISWSSSSIGQQYPMLRTFSIGINLTY